jgi:hypothetical protein
VIDFHCALSELYGSSQSEFPEEGEASEECKASKVNEINELMQEKIKANCNVSILKIDLFWFIVLVVLVCRLEICFTLFGLLA